MIPWNYTITVWKSDFKDFPGLYEATMWCMGAAIQNAKNFVVIRANNPYEMLERFNDQELYSTCLELANENNWTDKVLSMLHEMKYSSREVFQLICGKLNYPKGHIKREF
jgi:hypothetical protein